MSETLSSVRSFVEPHILLEDCVFSPETGKWESIPPEKIPDGLGHSGKRLDEWIARKIDHVNDDKEAGKAKQEK